MLLIIDGDSFSLPVTVCNVSVLQNTEEDSYYYEYPYYEDMDGKPYESTTDADATTKEVKVAC